MLHWGKSIEDAIAKLMEFSEKAQESAARGDDGDACLAVENAAALVECNCEQHGSAVETNPSSFIEVPAESRLKSKIARWSQLVLRGPQGQQV